MMVRKALEADPTNRTARDLRETLQRQIRQNELRPRIEAFVNAGREQLRIGQFESAIKSLESALHLDKSNLELQHMISEARTAWDRARQSSRMLEEARQSFTRGDLTAAQRIVSEALAADPRNADAAKLQAEIQKQIEARERERRLDEGLNHARRLLMLENFDEAISLLTALTKDHPQSGAARELLQRAETARKDQENRRRLQTATDEAKKLLKQELFAEALASLAKSRAEFPDSDELRDLALFAEEELQAQRRAQAIARVSAEASALMKAGQYDRALEILRAALGEHPGATALRELTQEVAAAKAAQERRSALDEAVARARALITEQRYHQAIERIEVYVRAYGESSELEPVRKEAEEALEHHRRQAAARQLAGDAQALLDQGRLDAATQVLEQGTIQFPRDAELERLLHEAQRRLKQHQQAEAISKIISEAESLSRARQYERALDALDKGLREHRGSDRLVRCREATLASAARYKREQEYSRALETIQELRNSGDLERALNAIDVALKRFTNDSTLLDLRHQTEADQGLRSRQSEMQRAINEARQLLERGDLESATRMLDAATARFPENASLAELKDMAGRRLREQRRAEAISVALQGARIAASAGRWDEALRGLEDAARAHGPDAEIDRTGEEISRARDATRDAAVREVAQTVGALSGAGKFDEAINAITACQRKIGDDTRLRDLLEEVQSERAARRDSIRAAIRQAAGLLEKDKPGEAVDLLDNAGGGSQPEFRDLLSRARARLAEQERDRTVIEIERSVQSLMASGHYAEALSEVDRAMQRYPTIDRIVRLKPEVIAARDRAQTLQEARTLHREGNFDGAIAVLNRVLQRTPASTEFQDLKRSIERDRDSTIIEIERSVQSLMASGHYAEALSELDRAMQQHPRVDRIARLKPEVVAARDRAQTLQEARTLHAEGDFDAAIAVLNRALQRTPGSAEFQELKRSIERDRDQRNRTADIEGALAQSRQLLKQDRPGDSVACLRPVVLRYPDDTALAEALADAEERLRRGEREAQLAAVRQEAEALLADGKPAEAIALLNGRFPGERRLSDLTSRAQEQLAWQQAVQAREQARKQLLDIEQQIASTRVSRLGKLGTQARRIAAPHASDAEVAAVVARIEAQITALTTAPRTKTPVPWKPIGAVTAAMVLLVVALAVWRPWSRPEVPEAKPVPTSRRVEIRTDPPGAAVTVGDRACTTPACSFDLAYGTYPVTARLDGYKPLKQTLTVDARAPSSTPTFTLDPEPPAVIPEGVKTGTLIVRAGIEGARVLIDGRPHGLTDAKGELNAVVQSGNHTVQVEKMGYRTPRNQRVVVGPGSASSVAVQMAALPARFQIRDAPSGAEVRTSSGVVARAEGGRTLSMEVPMGEQNLQIVEGNARRQITRRFEPGATVAVDWREIAPDRPAPAPPKINKEAQEWERVRATSDPAQLEAYLREYPSGAYSAEAQSRLDELTWGGVNRKDLRSLQAYLARFPRGAHSSEAEKLVDDLNWASVNKKSADALQAFLEQNADTQHRADAQALLEKLRAEAELQQQRTRAAAREREGILAALQRFNEAYLHKSTKELKDIWPSAPDDWVEAANARGSTFFIPTLYPAGDAVVSGDRASIKCDLITQTILRGRPQPQIKKPVTVTLRRAGSAWIIEDPKGPA
jgi:hypothetical protein